MRKCPCGSGAVYDTCCGRFHRGSERPATAEELMRSRYSAFVMNEPDYLFTTWHPRTRPDHVTLDDPTEWTGLKILDVVAGGPEDDEGVVEFVARYEGGQLHERSRFARRAGRWMYVDGDVG
ncbi:YchJ family protein [Nocardioides campestrisoli]|uniref:YchJ family protein n=1 Tax=Nocardioides campestrisoli TaxID=2736757 RepID=UPI0015E78E09